MSERQHIIRFDIVINTKLAGNAIMNKKLADYFFRCF